MKIGILTLSASDNCGSLLQAFSLQYILEKKYGHNVNIIDFRSKEAKNLYSVFPEKPLAEKKRTLNALMNYSKIKNQKKDYELFRKRYLNLTESVYKTEESLRELSNCFDCVICGSDQVWNVKMPDYSDAYFLDWYKGGMKIAYAASIGGHRIQEHEDVYRISKDVQAFDRISVRENSGISSVQEIYNGKIELCADPTLLISTDEWQNFAGKRIIEGDYIFYYSWAYSSDKVNKIVKRVSEEMNLPVYVINVSKWIRFKPQQYGFTLANEMGPSAFLSLMKYAKYALVQSFHGVIFAYKMKRNFWFLDDQPESKMDSRLNQILTLLEAKDRVLRDPSNVPKLDNYNYAKESSALKDLIHRSERFLGDIELKDEEYR